MAKLSTNHVELHYLVVEIHCVMILNMIQLSFLPKFQSVRFFLVSWKALPALRSPNTIQYHPLMVMFVGASSSVSTEVLQRLGVESRRVSKRKHHLTLNGLTN